MDDRAERRRALPGRELIGGKAWSVARMQALGLNVPPAVVDHNPRLRRVHRRARDAAGPRGRNRRWPSPGWKSGPDGVSARGPRPLLVSVRSGAPVSMPGMMDTVLNLGINDETEAALAEECGDPAFARNTHRRFLDLYAHIVLKAHPRRRPTTSGDPRDVARRDRRGGGPRNSARSQRAVRGGRARRVRIVEFPPRPALSPAPRHP